MSASESRGSFARAGTIAFATLALAHLAAGLTGDPRLWGTHALAYLPRGAWFAASLALVVLLAPEMACGAAAAGVAVAGRILGSRALLVAAALVAGVGLHAARIRYQFLGDGRVWVEKLQSHTSFQHFEPFAAALVRWVAGRIDAAHPENSAGAASIGLGVLYVLGTGFLCRALWRDRAPRALAWLLLLAHPVLLFFFGYVESYPLLLVLQVGVALGLVRAVGRGRGAGLGPAVLVGVAVASHLQAVAWLPCLIALAWVEEIGAAPPSPGSRHGIAASLVQRPLLLRAAFLCTVALVCGALLALGSGARPARLAADLRGESALGAVTAAWFFSWRHAVDLANEYVLLLGAPFVLVAAVLGARGEARAPAEAAGSEAPHAAWIPIACLFPGPLLVSWVVQPRIGGARDWDLYASLVLPAVLCSVEAWRRVQSVPGSPARAARPKPLGARAVPAAEAAGRALGLALVTSVAWLAVNLDAPRSARRMIALQDERGTFGNFARGYANETLGVYFRKLDPRAARDAYRRATQANAANPRYFNNLGNAEVQLQEIEAARDSYRKALELGMHEWPVVYNIGTCELQLGHAPEAERLFDQMTRDWPENWRGWASRGRARLELGRAPEALEDGLHARSLQADQPELCYFLGRVYHALGRDAEAKAAWEEALRLDPGFAAARSALGRLESATSPSPGP